jgi:hypothetical protein
MTTTQMIIMLAIHLLSVLGLLTVAIIGRKSDLVYWNYFKILIFISFIPGINLLAIIMIVLGFVLHRISIKIEYLINTIADYFDKILGK